MRPSTAILADLDEINAEILALARTPLKSKIGQTSMDLEKNLAALERERDKLNAELRIARTLEGRARPLERRLY